MVDFSGFEENNGKLQNTLLQRRVKEFESDSEVMMGMVSELRRERRTRKISNLEEREGELRDQLMKCTEGVRESVDLVEKFIKEQNK